MRLDRYLCEMNIGTRSRVKDYIRQGLVTVNGVTVKLYDSRIDENADKVAFRGKLLAFSPYVYFMLNKPAGVISATEDTHSKTVLDLLSTEDKRSDIFPAGRLDKDTEGLLLMTNDGVLAHRLLSPRKHVDKTYQVSIAHPLFQEDIAALEQGVDIGESRLTLPAKVSIVGEGTILLTIHEGKFHQVKRMLQAVGNQVTALKRVSFGGIWLDEKLAPGEYRELTEEEVRTLHES